MSTIIKFGTINTRNFEKKREVISCRLVIRKLTEQNWKFHIALFIEGQVVSKYYFTDVVHRFGQILSCLNFYGPILKNSIEIIEIKDP